MRATITGAWGCVITLDGPTPQVVEALRQLGPRTGKSAVFPGQTAPKFAWLQPLSTTDGSSS